MSVDLPYGRFWQSKYLKRSSREFSSTSCPYEALRLLKVFQLVSMHDGHIFPVDWKEGKYTSVANSDGMRKISFQPLKGGNHD
jgi:hypothetical protein